MEIIFENILFLYSIFITCLLFLRAIALKFVMCCAIQRAEHLCGLLCLQKKKIYTYFTLYTFFCKKKNYFPKNFDSNFFQYNCCFKIATCCVCTDFSIFMLSSYNLIRYFYIFMHNSLFIFANALFFTLNISRLATPLIPYTHKL